MCVTGCVLKNSRRETEESFFGDMAEDSKLVDLALKNNSYDVLIHICENEELDRLVRVVLCLFSLSLSLSHSH